jgi:aspartate racemase
MTTLGLIGGVGPESTIEYYRLLVEKYRAQAGGSYPPVIINSVDLKRLIEWITAGELGKVADYLVNEIEKLQRAGATFGAIASNTPHIVFDQIKQRTTLRLVSIVETTGEHVKSLGLKRVGLFGTRFTMKSRFYPDVFAKSGIELILPNDDEQALIHAKYMGELLNNQFLPTTRDELLAIADKLKERDAIEALILGGTELPLLLRDAEHNGIPLLDTTRIHVDRLVRELLIK